MNTPLLRLLERAHPERDQADLLAMLEAIPDKAPSKPAGRVSEPKGLLPLAEGTTPALEAHSPC